MNNKDHDQATNTCLLGQSDEGLRATRDRNARTRSERQATALRENLLKRKHQQRSRRQPQAPLPPES